jgi:hypothetical protein
MPPNPIPVIGRSSKPMVFLFMFFVGFLFTADLHVEAGPNRFVRGSKSSLVIGQKVEIGPNSFTHGDRGGLVM